MTIAYLIIKFARVTKLSSWKQRGHFNYNVYSAKTLNKFTGLNFKGSDKKKKITIHKKLFIEVDIIKL